MLGVEVKSSWFHKSSIRPHCIELRLGWSDISESVSSWRRKWKLIERRKVRKFEFASHLSFDSSVCLFVAVACSLLMLRSEKLWSESWIWINPLTLTNGLTETNSNKLSTRCCSVVRLKSNFMESRMIILRCWVRVWVEWAPIIYQFKCSRGRRCARFELFCVNLHRLQTQWNWRS